MDVPMSKEHMKDFAGWLRPAELLKTAHEDDQFQGGTNVATMLPSRTVNLVQDVTADCSVVASLCAALARPRHSYVDVC